VLPVEYLFTMDVTASTPATVLRGGPRGTRVVAALAEGSFDGPKLNGTVVPFSGGDWATMRGSGNGTVDVRLTLKTNDGAEILMTYTGILRRGPAGTEIRTAPLFETGDERYAWLNQVQAVGIGKTTAGGAVYDVYALS
jgi:Protein of unknown function (DUF3237)